MGTTISKRNLSLAPIDDVLNKIGLRFRTWYNIRGNLMTGIGFFA